ncbi:MAG: NAD(P)/FAD-dependent oxidoreductase [Proteobacteria bacterium]|nr:NAD(P)/FAD-dependent oxidoreductase [Pseudomonadota bacterium]
MTERFDAAVIGSGVGGLAAAALLAKSGLRTVLCERGESVVGSSGLAAFRALDPQIVKALRLSRRGLKFAQRDLALSFIRNGGQPLALGRDRHAVARALAGLSQADAAAFVVFRREVFALSKALRPAWWDGASLDETASGLKAAQRKQLSRLAVTSAAAWLSEHFESDALKAALAFDAATRGFAPGEPGSALALLWSSAQEMCGLQGAVAIPRGGQSGVLQALAQAAQKHGVELRSSATVASLAAIGNTVSGLELASGEQIEATAVVSALSRRVTLGSLAPTALIGIAAARALMAETPHVGAASLIMGLNRSPEFGGAASLGDKRIVIAEKLETYEVALSAARLGRMPQEPAIELVLPPAEKSAQQLASRLQLHVRAWPVPLGDGFDRDLLVRAVTTLIERHVPGFGGGVASCDALTLDALTPSIARLSASAEARIATPIRGLFVCGSDAEPADAVSGRAARQAAHAAIAWLRRGGQG